MRNNVNKTYVQKSKSNLLYLTRIWHDDDYKTEPIGVFSQTSSLIKVGKLDSESAGGFLHRQTGFVT